jgi:predicted negative regulator of RcsB-dependent stress response
VDVYRTDEEQGEALKGWLRENGLSLVTGVLLGLAALFGIKAWTEYGDRRAEGASHLYTQVVAAIGAGQSEDATRAYDEMIKEFAGSQYAVLAALQMAKVHIEKDDLAGARGQLQWAYEHAKDEGIRHSVRLRLARVLLGSGDADAAEQLIAGVDAPSYTALYEELRGDIARARGDLEAAHAAYERALAAMPEQLPGHALIEAKRDDTVRAPDAGPTS